MTRIDMIRAAHVRYLNRRLDEEVIKVAASEKVHTEAELKAEMSPIPDQVAESTDWSSLGC